MGSQKRLGFSLLLIVLCMSASPRDAATRAAGNVYYAAPNGVPSNAGTSASPWDLQTALSGSIPAGSTVYLKGGTYKGNFISNLHGDPANPITVRSAPGEWAVLDSHRPITLAAPLAAAAGYSSDNVT